MFLQCRSKLRSCIQNWKTTREWSSVFFTVFSLFICCSEMRVCILCNIQTNDDNNKNVFERNFAQQMFTYGEEKLSREREKAVISPYRMLPFSKIVLVAFPTCGVKWQSERKNNNATATLAEKKNTCLCCLCIIFQILLLPFQCQTASPVQCLDHISLYLWLSVSKRIMNDRTTCVSQIKRTISSGSVLCRKLLVF